MNSFSQLHLNPLLLDRLQQLGFSTPTPIQSRCIPALLAQRDLLGIAQTGTGKTAAFALPLLHHLHLYPTDYRPFQVRALVLAPTRELALQIKGQFSEYGSALSLRLEAVIGGQRRDLQVEALSLGVDIVVGTPGRVLDLIKSGEMIFSHLTHFVLDEADMMLDMGFLADVEEISKHLPSAIQKILFSATMPAAIEDLAKRILTNPEKIEVTPESTTVEKIEQSIFFVDDEDKLSLLIYLLQQHQVDKAMVFCKAKYGVAMVVEHLQRSGIRVGEIHSNLGQLAREEALKQFSEGAIQVLVATDIASRGIDIPLVTHVINFNIPEDPTNYVHRIGRTARAGMAGISYSLCGEKELPLLRNVEKLISKKIQVNTQQPFHQDYIIPKKRSNRRSGQRRR